MQVTEAMFREKTGRASQLDDLERVNCAKAGQPGHQQCGWCELHGPRYECGCPLPENCQSH